MFSPILTLARIARAFFVILTLTLALGARAGIVINEIMYRPGSAYPENTGLEYIELHNTDAAPVDISGWALTSGTSFTFPAATSIAAGGFVVIASDPAAAQTEHGITGVFGPWAVGSALANSGEKVTISKPGLAPGTWDTVDSVTYANEGDWGARVREAAFGGWAWSSAADTGKSLELRNAGISNDNGQNWTPSTAATGTPGAVNSVAVANVAPIIREVKHSPAVPTNTQDVVISCDTTDETTPAGLTATLFYRDATTTTPGSFLTLAMTGDGTGKFSATLGPGANLAIIEFYISVSDGTNTRTWPAPSNEGQNANCQYLVTNEVLGNDNYYFLVLTAAENAAFDNVNDNSDRVFNETFIARNGSDTTIRYRSGMRIRGNSSRTYQFRPLRITIPNDEDFDDYTSFNLAPRSPHLQFLGQRLMQAAGIRASDSAPVELRRNGVESTTNTGNTPDYGKWARIEDEGGDFVKRHWPAGQNNGNFYKKADSSGGDFYWRSTGGPTPTDPDTIYDGHSKQGNSAQNDWTDLTAFFSVIQTAAQPYFPGAPVGDVAQSNGGRLSGTGVWNNGVFTAAEITSIETVADLDQWARWFAAMTILQSTETNISNGVDDDFGLVFMPVSAQRKMQIVAHDLDSIFGFSDTGSSTPTFTGLYDVTEGGQAGYGFRTLLPLFGTATQPGNAAWLTKYHTALRELYGTVFDADNSVNPNPSFYQFVDSHLAGWVPAATRDAIKAFATARQAYLLDLIPDGVEGGTTASPIIPAAATSTGFLNSTPASTLIISEILADNVAAVNVGGLFPDIVEIRNIGGATADLTGMTLSDDSAVAKYTFPASTTLAAGARMVLYADGTTAAGHMAFSIDSSGESLYLRDTVANGGTLLDSVTFGTLPADYTLGRVAGGASVWSLCEPTLGNSNIAIISFAAPGSLRINEWASRSDYLIEDDFLEIHNSAAQPVAIGGMTLTDDTINYPAQHALPVLSFVGPASFIQFKAKGGNASASNATELPFNMDASFGHVALIGQNGTVVDRQDIITHAADVSVGRTPDSDATITSFGLPTNIPTPGASNVAPPAGVLALLNNLRITEVLYTPGNLEFIELHNIGATTLDIAGVRFTRGLTYTFPAGSTLASGAYIVVCKDRVAFQAQFGFATPLAPGEFTGSLDNAGEVIAFQPPAPWDVNILKFAYSPTWFVPQTNNGYSLTVIDDVTTPARDWGDKSTWTTSLNLYGTPGSGPPPTVTSASIASSVLSDPFNYQITATQVPTSYGATGLPAGITVNTTNGLISGAPTEAGVFNLVVSATNAGGIGTKNVTLTIDTSGPLASFTWSSISNQFSAQPFAATLTAKDSAGRTVTSFNGNVGVTAQGTGATGSVMVITECGTNTPDYFEIQNVGNATANTAGWFIIPNNANGGGSGLNSIHPAWQLPATIAAGQVIAINEETAGVYPGSINWTGSNFGGGGGGAAARNGWCMLCDATGAVRDFVGWGYTGANITSINIPSITVGSTTYTNITVPAAQWSGNGTTANNFQGIKTRGGTTDLNTAANWTEGDSDANKGLQNTGLTVPFIPPPPTYTVTPSSVALVNGVRSGNLSITSVASGIHLVANDGAGHTGNSNNFNVASSPPPVVTSPNSAITAVGSFFSYQITGTNSPTSYNAIGLPAGLTVSTSTGLISGTPTTAASPNVTLFASNTGGNGNLSLALQVQADSDGDGMGDAWETTHGLSVGVNDASLDLDGDGQSNGAEWRAGTSPSNPSSRFHITSFSTAGADFTLTWAAVPGRRYRVTSTTALSGGSWTNLTPTALVPNAASGTWTHIGGFTGPTRNYRVEVVP